MNAMKNCLVASMCLVFLSACGGSGGGTSVPTVVNNVPDAGNAGVTDPTDVTNANTDLSSGPSHIISGDISLLSDDLPVGDISVRVRDTEIQALRQADGKFYIAVPDSDVDSEVVLDFTGENVVEKNLSLTIPADATHSSVSATLASRTPPISFDLNAGGDLKNEESPTRTTVSVPANAFQFSDGTPATGMAQVSITELDIHDWSGDYSWAPNFIGIPEGDSEPRGITTFGMSEFHFSQDGRTLDLRPGVNATLSMDLATPSILIDESGNPVDAVEGAVLPLWYYDTDDLVWKEEGEVVITADTESDSDFRATGEVSHFTFWNIDYVFPNLNGNVYIVVVDQDGNTRNDVEVLTYHTTVRVPAEYGQGKHGEAPWQNSAVLTPLNNTITVMGNWEGRDPEKPRLPMDVLVSNITTRDHGVIGNGVMEKRHTFDVSVGDYSVYFEVVVEDPEPTPELMAAEVVVELVDLDGEVRSDVTVSSYKVLVATESNNGFTELSYSANLLPTPSSRRTVTVVGNTPEYLDSGAEPATMRISLEQLLVEDGREVQLLAPISVVHTFNTEDRESRVVLTVPVVDF